MMSRSKAVLCGILAGLIAGIAMTLAMLLLAWLFQIATPLVILGDRLSVFISPKPFFWIMGRVGGYNHLKQLGVGSSILGQILVGAIGGIVYGLVRRKRRHRAQAFSHRDFQLRRHAIQRRGCSGDHPERSVLLRDQERTRSAGGRRALASRSDRPGAAFAHLPALGFQFHGHDRSGNDL